MGLKDSSQTRVEPVFERLYERDPTGHDWLPDLLQLPERPDGHRPQLPADLGTLDVAAWGKKERQLAPPRALLEALLERGEEPERGNTADERDDTEDPTELRRRLLQGDPKTVEKASTLLGSGNIPARAWFVLEGPTSIDAYLETESLIIVIEGKRTEPGPTTQTTYMPIRHQILRNLDAAYAIRGSKAVVGFFIVGDDSAGLEVPEAWRAFAEKTVAPAALDQSLPHRTPEERQAIADSFAGVTTWRRVCEALDIPYDELPDTVV